MSEYNKNDAAKDTKTTESEVSSAWHDARNDAVKSGDLEERNINKVSDSETGKELYEIFKETVNPKNGS